ncbi:MAG: carboxypeptidase regulatory-like domain-containing protein [Planctomycetes bacterium]|nr:carboxypeptidase regulatory-like domain-containing protein [Planctomycetota bacterium]
MERLPMETLPVTLDAGVMGRVRWLHGADPRRLHRPLHGVPDEDLPAWRTLPEALVLRVPKHDWLWICAELHDGSRRWTRYVRLPPARGPRALDLRGSAGPTIHGLVYADGLDSPAKGARLVAGRGNEEPRGVTCDEEGFFSLAGLPAAPVELKVQGEAIGAAPRNAMRVICGPAPPFDAHVITLVAPPHTTSIELDIAADAEQGQLDAARLALRRIDCDGTLVPLLSRIPRGSCRATLRVPAGDWVFDVVPRGAFDIVTPREIVRVADEPLTRTVRLRGNPRRTTLELRGLRRSDFPVRVQPCDPQILAGVDGELEFLGPYHWQRPIESIAAPEAPCHVLVRGRGAQWLSAATIARDAERCIVDLVPARRLEFVWIDGPDARRKLSLAVGGESSGDRASAVRRCLVPWSGSEVPGWHANLVVPRSAVTLECLDQDGFLLWSTSLAAGEASAVISLQGLEPRVLRPG